MRLRQIEIFHAVYSTGSITRAGELLGISQPAISKTLRRTEDVLGYPLFERTGTGLVPTHEATVLFESAARIFAEVRRFRTRTGGTARGAKTPLRVAFTPSIGFSKASGAIAAFARASPDVTIDIETFHFEEAVNAIRSMAVDIAIVYQPYPYEGLRVLPVASAGFVCITPEGHWQDREKKVRFKDLAGQNLIHLNTNSPLGRLLDTHLDGISKTGQSRKITVNTYYIACMLVANGAGIAIIDEFAARAFACNNIDVYRLDEDIGLSVGAIVRKNHALNNLERKFLTILSRELDSVAAPDV